MKQFINYRLFFHFNHNNVSTLQLHLKSEKYKLNKNMEGIVKYNIKKKNPSHSKSRNKTSYLYAHL